MILLAGLSLESTAAFGQTEPGAGARNVTLKQKDAAAPAKLAPGTGGAAAKKDVAKNPTPAKPAAEDAATEPNGSFVDGLVSFIRARAAWIVGALGVLLAGVLAWAYVAGRGKSSKGEDTFAELGLGAKAPKTAAPAPPARFSSTKIHASDVNSRLSRSVKTTEVETDREYALVVDEEALKMPPLPEDAAEREGHRGASSSSSRNADATQIQQMLEAKNLKGAYAEYARQVESAASISFQGDLERTLAEHLIQAKEIEKASAVLEHHVATRSKAEVEPDVFFNLGYIHFQRKTLAKSQRYLTLFVEREKNPAYIARAKKILARIKSTPAQN